MFPARQSHSAAGFRVVQDKHNLLGQPVGIVRFRKEDVLIPVNDLG